MATNNQQVAVVKVALGLMALCLGGYVLGPPLYWYFKEALAAFTHSSPSSSFSCPPCLCDCSSQPLLSIPRELSNAPFADCATHVTKASGEAEKNFADILIDMLKLREAEALESQQRSKIALIVPKRMTHHYQKEADKCNSGMETCEEAREKAEAALVAQKRVTAMWEQRARQRAWKEGVSKSRVQSEGNVQAMYHRKAT